MPRSRWSKARRAAWGSKYGDRGHWLVRSRHGEQMKHGKNYTEKSKLVDEEKLYGPTEAIKLAKKTSFAKFDETVELHLRTGLDPRHADQQLRGTTLLPNGLGKTVTVVVFAEGEAARFAVEAGADFYGGDELIKRVEDGWTDF